MTLSSAQERWVAAGLAGLTGDSTGPCLVPPSGIIERIETLGSRDVDVLPLLGERAALLGLARGGTVSCGGATRLLEAADGWIALALARPDDVDLLPAWLGIAVGDGVVDEEVWSAVAAAMKGDDAERVVERGRELGLPVAWLSSFCLGSSAHWAPDPSQNEGALDGVLVVDLSSLWAGPLCSRLLADGGAHVIKVESTLRPDGARQGNAAFFDRLHAGKRSVALDFTDPGDRRRLAELVTAADVVIEGSRPRALRQLGIVAEKLVASGPRVWVSITGHGRDPAHELAVGFGDDAAVAGGLVAWGSDSRPRFAVDAVADPLTGIAAHRAVLAAVALGERRLIDVSLAGVAAGCVGADAGVAWTEIDPGEAPGPRARAPHGAARPLGADTVDVLRELGIS